MKLLVIYAGPNAAKSSRVLCAYKLAFAAMTRQSEFDDILIIEN